MLNTTVGQLLVNEALPPEMRDYNRVLTGKELKAVLQQVAREHPERYRDISFKLNQIGQRSAQDQGGFSFGSRHLRRSPVANKIRARLQVSLKKILDDDTLTDEQRQQRIVRVVGKEMGPQIKDILAQADKDKNPLALQVLSGTRGKPMNLTSLLGSDLLYSDHRDEVIPIPVLRSYSEGMSPEEYWAGTYGARRGIIATKFATQEAGFLSKQLNQAGHRLVVVDDDDKKNFANRGMIVDTDDEDNEGSLLARDAGPYKRNTPLTPKILKHLKRLGKNRILVRSPLVGGSPSGGIYARDVGIRETGKLPGRGEQVGLQAAQALSEPISQGQLSAKHSGGVAGQEKAVGGFQYINQLIQVPKKMQGGAAHAELDGRVQRIEDAPAGGKYVTINDKQHFVGSGFDLAVKPGQDVEAGDLISSGIPNPALIVQHKGVGEGRRYFVNEFRKAMASSGMRGHRRNIELLARGLINHVKMTDETDDHAPDDVVPYSTLEHTYKPRSDSNLLGPKKAVGQYLEKPVLHYTIGTKVRPSMLKDLEEFGVKELSVHKNPPPFQPHMVRGMYQLQHDPDWMTQMYGSGLKKSLLNSVARGGKSEERGSSFVPSLAAGTDFGEDKDDRKVIQPEPSYALPKLAEDSGSSFFGGKFKVAIDQATGLDYNKNPNFLGNTSNNPLAYQAGDADSAMFQMSSLAMQADPQAAGKLFGGNNAGGNRSLAGNKKIFSNLDSNIMPGGGMYNTNPGGESPGYMSQFGDYLTRGVGEGGAIDTAADFSRGLPQFSYATNLLSRPSTGITNIDKAIGNSRIGQSIASKTKPIQAAGQTINNVGNTVKNTASKVVKPVTNAASKVVKPVVQGATNAVNTIRGVNTANKVVNSTKAVTALSKGPVAAGSKLLGPLSFAIEGGLIGYDINQKMNEGKSFERAWEDQANEGAQRTRDLFTTWDSGDGGIGGHTYAAGKKVFDTGMHVLSPVQTVQSGTQLIKDTGGLLINDSGLSEALTPGTPMSRNTEHQKTEMAAQTNQRNQQLQEQQSKIDNSLSSNIMPEERAVLERQQQDIANQISDNNLINQTYEDETADWDLFDQHYVMGGGDYFRDNAAARRDALNNQVHEMQQMSNLPQGMTQLDLENMQARANEYKHNVDMYDRVGMFGDFSKEDYQQKIRVNVQKAQESIIDIQARMREPGVQNNPQLMNQLAGDVVHHQQRLADYRSFAENAQNQRVGQ